MTIEKTASKPVPDRGTHARHVFEVFTDTPPLTPIPVSAIGIIETNRKTGALTHRFAHGTREAMARYGLDIRPCSRASKKKNTVAAYWLVARMFDGNIYEDYLQRRRTHGTENHDPPVA